MMADENTLNDEQMTDTQESDAQVSDTQMPDSQALAAQLEEERKLKESYLANWQRTQADFENFKRRSRQEQESIARAAKEDLLLKLLPTVDNFERALKFGKSDEMSSDAKALADGVELVYKQLLGFLEKEEVTPIEAEGKQFDPHLHEAVMSMQSDEHPESTVLEEFQKGYMYGAKVLRPSMVKVSVK